MSEKIKNLTKARKAKNDEFYTLYEDIEKEVSCYPLDTWKDKTVYCNCDDPNFSNFWKFFVDNFKKLNLKELHATCIERSWGTSYHWVYDGNKTTMTALRDKGDFRSDECVEILKEADIVVTNPPFSLFREYVAQLIKHNKDFLIIGPQNAIKYENVFPHIKNEKIYLGFSGRLKNFVEPSGKIVSFGNICWYTTIAHDNPYKIKPRARYFDSTYQKYDNYDAINVDRIKDIPWDYDGVIGVPITYLLKHNPKYFKIVGLTKKWAGSINEIVCTKTYEGYIRYSSDGVCLNKSSKSLCDGFAMLRGKGNKTEYHMNDCGDIVHQLYDRIFIKRKKA